MNDIQAPWIGDDDYGKRKGFSEEDYNWHWQDDIRKDEDIRSSMQEMQDD